MPRRKLPRLGRLKKKCNSCCLLAGVEKGGAEAVVVLDGVEEVGGEKSADREGKKKYLMMQCGYEGCFFFSVDAHHVRFGFFCFFFPRKKIFRKRVLKLQEKERKENAIPFACFYMMLQQLFLF